VSLSLVGVSLSQVGVSRTSVWVAQIGFWFSILSVAPLQGALSRQLTPLSTSPLHVHLSPPGESPLPAAPAPGPCTARPVVQYLLERTVMSREDILDLLASPRAEIESFGVTSLRLFGSVARGEASTESDIDLLVSFRETPTFSGFMKLRIFLEDLLGNKVDLVTESGLRERARTPFVSRAEEGSREPQGGRAARPRSEQSPCGGGTGKRSSVASFGETGQNPKGKNR